jgi:hypothetical protein
MNIWSHRVGKKLTVPVPVLQWNIFVAGGDK